MAITPYCTIDQVKLALNNLQDTTLDPLITEMIGEAQDLLDTEIGFAHQVEGDVNSPVTKVYSGNNAQQIWIDPCISFSQVIEKIRNHGVVTGTNDITALVSLGPVNVNPGYILEFYDDDDEFTIGRKNYEVTGIWGYDTVPARLTRACIRLVTHWYGMVSTYYGDTLGEQNAVRIRYDKQIPKDVQQIIDSFHQTLFLSRES